MELLLGAMVVALWVKTIPGVIADAITTMRMSKAGQWDLLDKDRDRKAARAAARRKAVAAVRAKRHKRAGGDGNYRPGMRAYLGDVYHGFWEDALEKRTARRAGRPPNRYDRAVEAKVDRQRRRSGRLGRVARALIDPVGERRQPADVVPPQPSDAGRSGGPGAPVDPWPDGDEPTVDLADGPRTACPVCGDTLTQVDGGWSHPKGSTCALGYPLEDGPVTGRPADNVPATPASSPADRTEATDPAEAASHPDTSNPTSNGGTPMTDRVHDYFSAVLPYRDAQAQLRGNREYDNHGAGSTPASNGGTAMTTATTEINTNEDARQAFASMAAAAAEANDAIAALEAAKAKMAAAANGTADGMSAKAFDVDATTAAAEAADAISLGTLADWSERVDAVLAAAERGTKALDKYRDSEDVVASNNVDPTTLASTSS